MVPEYVVKIRVIVFPILFTIVLGLLVSVL